MKEIAPEPVALIVNHPNISTLYLKPITAGAYSQMTLLVKKGGQEGLTLEAMVKLLLTDNSRQEVEQLEIPNCHTINDKLDILLPASRQEIIGKAITEHLNEVDYHHRTADH